MTATAIARIDLTKNIRGLHQVLVPKARPTPQLLSMAAATPTTAERTAIFKVTSSVTMRFNVQAQRAA